MPSLFTKIISGELPCHKLYETEDYLAFLDIRPIREGHALAIPKKEIDYIFSADDELLGGLIVFSKKVALAIEKAVDCKRVGVMVAGLEVPHLHIHLVPIVSVGDLNFSLAKAAENDVLAETAARIREHLT